MRARSFPRAWIAAPVAAVAILVALGARHESARADAPPGRYANGADGSVAWVKDGQTGLVWKRDEEPGTWDFATAPTKCVSPWRLPTVSELQTLVDDTQTSGAAIDATFFPGTTQGRFWTSTVDAQSLALPKAWTVAFAYGDDVSDNQSSTNHVRCVR